MPKKQVGELQIKNMGKTIFILVLIQGLMAVLMAFMISKMSFMGRMGITFLYREYLVLKSPWKTAALIFVVQLFLIVILAFFKYFTPAKIANAMAIFTILVGLGAAYFTYLDFTTTSHKYMKSNFHIGVYLFWVSWIFSAIFFLFLKKKKVALTNLEPTITNSVTE
ncbi:MULTISPECIES: cytochrome d ubiquinol oxidase subunit II [unclassified Myroides]|uniref:cytochrome d ubiquinol oxidase subunit II n=1 Tax=unclassified Myroides TaxID=2642485 RepID=UPI002575C9FE|nr:MULTISPECIES: cytochrome d ubiquinol oxidase subunit II [unclassified Myroides]